MFLSPPKSFGFILPASQTVYSGTSNKGHITWLLGIPLKPDQKSHDCNSCILHACKASIRWVEPKTVATWKESWAYLDHGWSGVTAEDVEKFSLAALCEQGAPKLLPC
jgi:hypothetical protein